MSRIIKARMTSRIEGDFVVFLIGFRINKFWKVWKWWPVFTAMPGMLRELAMNKDLGLLHARTHFGFNGAMVVQYWRSFDHLHAYATDKTRAHLPAWARFNRSVGTDGDVGIWHETFLVRAGEYEAIYGNMPKYGLGYAGEFVEAAGGHRSAKGCLGQSDGQDQPIRE